MNIAEQLIELVSQGDSHTQLIRWGDVTSISPFEVRLAGDTVDIGIELRLTGYSPTTNDRVLLLDVGGRWIVLDKVVSA